MYPPAIFVVIIKFNNVGIVLAYIRYSINVSRFHTDCTKYLPSNWYKSFLYDTVFKIIGTNMGINKK